MNFVVVMAKPIASSDARVLEGKWMVWGQFFDPNINQDTVRKLFLTAFF
jgi:hypothetical protein